METIFKIEAVTHKDMVIGKIRRALWRVRKFCQRKPTFINNYIIRVK